MGFMLFYLIQFLFFFKYFLIFSGRQHLQLNLAFLVLVLPRDSSVFLIQMTHCIENSFLSTGPLAHYLNR